jgi:hypothetical protein
VIFPDNDTYGVLNDAQERGGIKTALVKILQDIDGDEKRHQTADIEC